MTPIWWSIALAAIGIVGIYLAGKKNRWGWAVGVFAQLLWIAYALGTQQWGFIASALAYGGIYGWNWVKWERERKSQTLHPCTRKRTGVTTMTTDPQDRFHCAICGQAWVVPSLALYCASRHDLPHEVT